MHALAQVPSLAIPTPAPHHRLRTLPYVAVTDRRVVCNGRALDLARRPLALRVFEAFLAAPSASLSRDEVVAIVYPGWREAPRTERYEHSCIGNTVKMLSRCRQLAQHALSNGSCAGLRWLPYDAETRTWSLYALTPEYLSAR